MTLPILLHSVADFLRPEVAWAFEIDTPTSVGGVTGLIMRVSGLPALMKDIFIGVLFLFLFFYAGTMVIFSHDDSAMGEAKTAYLYAIIGCAVVGLATILANAITPGQVGAGLIEHSAVSGALSGPIMYMKYALAAVLVANIAIQGFRLISSHGEQEYIDKARKRLVAGFIGVIIVILSDAIVRSTTPGYSDYGTATADIGIANTEVVGIINFILTIIGAAIVLVLVIAGFILIISVNDRLKDLAKTFIKTGIVVLIVMLVSWALVNTFIILGNRAA